MSPTRVRILAILLWAIFPITASAVPLSRPDGFTATAAGCRQVQLEWQNVPQADFYMIWRNGSPLQVTTTNSHLDGLQIHPSGTYRYQLAAINLSRDQSTAAEVTISNLCAAPVAVLGIPEAVESGTPIQLDGSGSYDPDGSIVSYQWTFGDVPGFASGVSVVHVYDQPGVYWATLTVTDDSGERDTAFSQVVVEEPTNNGGNQPPVANAGDDVTGREGETIFFNGYRSQDLDGYIAAWHWDFGDGTQVNGRSAGHIYDEPGTYTAVLTVTDNEGATDSDSLLVTVEAINNGGDYMWSTQFGGPAGLDRAAGYSVACDANGDIVVAGSFWNNVDFGNSALQGAGLNDVLLAKYTDSGTNLWSVGFGSGLDDMALGVAIDDAGDIVVTGQFNGTVDLGGVTLSSAGMADIFLAKYSSSGSLRWARSMGGPSNDRGSDIALDPSGNIFLTGFVTNAGDLGGGRFGTNGVSDAFVAKYTPSGDHHWSLVVGGSSADNGRAVAADLDGNVVVTGAFKDSINLGAGSMASAGADDGFVAKYSSTGNHLWSMVFGTSDIDTGDAVAVDINGDIALGGTYGNPLDFGGGPLPGGEPGSMFIVRLDASGDHLWSRGYPRQFAGGITPLAMAMDYDGSLVVSGAAGDTVDFGGAVLQHNGTLNIFAVKFTAEGDHLWSGAYGRAFTDEGSSVAIDGSGHVIMSGYFDEVVDFGGGEMSDQGGADGFLVKFTP